MTRKKDTHRQLLTPNKNTHSGIHVRLTWLLKSNDPPDGVDAGPQPPRTPENFDPRQFAGVSNRSNLTTLLSSNQNMLPCLIMSRRAHVQESASVGSRLRGSCFFLLPGMFSVSKANGCSVQVIRRKKHCVAFKCQLQR